MEQSRDCALATTFRNGMAPWWIDVARRLSTEVRFNRRPCNQRVRGAQLWPAIPGWRLCGRRADWSKEGVMKTTGEEANSWLFKVVIIFIVAGFLLSLIPLAKAQETQKGKDQPIVRVKSST
ncbi:MAG TPA: hypothetical protein VKF35_13450 [Hyphomicrobiaceae bacterium]|nr:hypothetical protein [Hyphomicrobiaceae bacterium]